MSQIVFNQIDPAVVDGIDLSNILNDFKDALMSGLKGPTRPAETTAGGGWIDDSQESSSSLLIYKVYTGSSDVTIFTVNKTTNTVSIPGADNFFEISKVSDDAAGAAFSLFKKRVTGTGGVKSGDVVGEIQLNSTASDGVKYLVGRIRYVAGEDATDSSHGGHYVIEGTRIGQGTLSEFLRIAEGRLGIGLSVSPTHAVHVRSQTGIKNERLSDDATGPKIVSRKARIASSGQVQTSDEIKVEDINSTDNAGAEFTAARMIYTAEEAHTAITRGAKLSLSIIPKGSNTLSEVFNISQGKVTWAVTTVQDSLERKTQTFPSVAEVKKLDASNSFIEVTGTTAMTLKGILNTSKSKSFVLYNGTTQNITIVNQAPDVTADDRIAVNGEASFTLQPGKSVEFFRRVSNSRWVPMVEGNTGITYNEAVQLQAKMIAKTWIEEGQQGSTDPADFVTGIFMVRGNESAVACYGQNKVLAISRATGQDTLVPPSGPWNDAASWEIPSPPGLYTSFLAVRDTGTDRSFDFTTNTGGGAQNLINATSSWRGVVSIGDGDFLAVASAGTYRTGKRLGATWSYLTPTTIDVPLYGVAFGNNKVVAVGGPVPGGSSNHGAWVSTDKGDTWNSFALPNESTVTYYRVRFCNGLFVALGGLPGTGMVIVTSSDGETWTSIYTAAIGTTLRDVAWCGGLYLVATDKEEAIISTDGVGWISVDSIPLISLTSTGVKFLAASGSGVTGPYFLKSLAPSF